jgi:hypothetical protein
MWSTLTAFAYFVALLVLALFFGDFMASPIDFGQR